MLFKAVILSKESYLKTFSFMRYIFMCYILTHIFKKAKKNNKYI